MSLLCRNPSVFLNVTTFCNSRGKGGVCVYYGVYYIPFMRYIIFWCYIFYYISFLILFHLLLYFANTILCSKDAWANPDISLIVEVLTRVSFWWIIYQCWGEKVIYGRECFYNFLLNKKFTKFWGFSPLEPEHL